MSANPGPNPGSPGQVIHGSSGNMPAAAGSPNHQRPEPIAEHDRIAPRVMPAASTLGSNKEYSDVVINFFDTLKVVAENGRESG